MPGAFSTRLNFGSVDRVDFRYIVASRPGYPRTPLSVGKTPKEQAAAFAALLDALKIDKVAVFGGRVGDLPRSSLRVCTLTAVWRSFFEDAVSMQIRVGQLLFLEAAVKNTVGYDFSLTRNSPARKLPGRDLCNLLGRITGW